MELSNLFLNLYKQIEKMNSYVTKIISVNSLSQAKVLKFLTISEHKFLISYLLH
jgi:hypothetical protein